MEYFFMKKLTHFDSSGRPGMVDVSGKNETLREATATAEISMKPETFRRIIDRKIEKGDVLGTAQIAGIMAAKRTSDLIPMCHPLNISSVSLEFIPKEKYSLIKVKATVKITSRTGVEMEALMAVSIASLTIYDMCKAVDREMTISDIKLIKKSGGKSGVFERKK
jgi:cyclic pyranopterin phosphate synthase